MSRKNTHLICIQLNTALKNFVSEGVKEEFGLKIVLEYRNFKLS